ncbi:MAG: antitoxin [Eggerthellaceae bacterium]|nr:antitoxin [Eggerthellaceae bacterium]
MREEYDFSNSVANPYAKRTRRQVTMNLDVNVIDYFKARGAETDIPYQRLINLYLSRCAPEGKKIAFV